MPADSNIFAQYLKAPKSIMDYNAEADQAQSRKNALQLAAMDLSERTQANQRQVAVRNSLMGLGANATDDQRINALRATATPEGYAQADSLEKILMDRQKTGAEVKKNTSQAANFDAGAAKTQYETARQKHDDAIKEIASFDSPQHAIESLQQHAAKGSIDPAAASAMQASIPQDPAQFQAWQLQTLRKLMTAKDQIAQVSPDANARLSAETSRSNNSANIAAADRRHNETIAEGKTVIVQGEDGPMLVSKTDGTGKAVVGPDGLPVGKPLKQIPASVNTAIITNTQNLQKAQTALKLLEGGEVGPMKGDTSATGMKGVLPGAILNRMDPKGVDTRAAIADLGSMVLHDRSGAAVTASEYPRLQPFIPSATDDKVTAAKKLRRFIEVYNSENQALNQTYSKEQGYRPSPVKSSVTTAAAGVPDDIAAILATHGGKK
jgi:hypothetical protein